MLSLNSTVSCGTMAMARAQAVLGEVAQVDAVDADGTAGPRRRSDTAGAHSVLFPEPEWPTTATVPPAGTRKLHALQDRRDAGRSRTAPDRTRFHGRRAASPAGSAAVAILDIVVRHFVEQMPHRRSMLLSACFTSRYIMPRKLSGAASCSRIGVDQHQVADRYSSPA
jgi:hypothetical protein